jgi:hypothetical protein
MNYRMLSFVKSRRAQSVDDHETWIESGITPTLNAFDGGDTRSTVIIVRMRQGKAGGGEGSFDV